LIIQVSVYSEAFIYINSRHLRQNYLRHILDVNNVVNKELSEEERLVLGIIKKEPSTSAKKIGEIINKIGVELQKDIAIINGGE